MASETSSALARQPSGIRAVPSNDDDDDYYYFDDDNDFDVNLVNDVDYDNSVDGFAKVNDNNTRNMSLTNDSNNNNDFSGVSSISKSSESSTISSGSNTSFSSGYTRSLVNGGDEEFEGDPGEETQQKKVGIARNGSLGTVGGLPCVPVAKVSEEGDDDDDDLEVGIGEEDGGEEEEGLYGVLNVVPRVRVLDEEAEEDEWGDAVETPRGDVGEGDGKVEENADAVVSVSEGKYIKDSTYTDVVVTGSAAAEDREDTKEPEVGEGNEETPVMETVSADSAALKNGVNSTDEVGAVMDSSSLDAAEAVKSGTTVVEEPKLETPKGNEGEIENGLKVEASKGYEGEIENGPKVEAPKSNEGEIEDRPKLDNPIGDEGMGKESVESSEVGSASEGGSTKLSYAEVAASGNAAAEDRDDVKEAEVGGENEETRALETALADSAANVGSKYMGDEDEVVDSITVDATEAARSGTAVVGESQEMKDPGGVSESSVVENSVADDLKPDDSKLIETDDVKSVDEVNSFAWDSDMKGTELEVKENSAPVAEDVVSSNDLVPLVTKNSEQKASQTNDPEPLQPADNVEQHYTEEIKPEAELQTKQQEPTDEQKSDSDGKNEKAKPLDDESDNVEKHYTEDPKPEAEIKGTELEVKENSAPDAEDVASSNDLAPPVSKNPEDVDDGDEQKKASETNGTEPLQPADNAELYTEETKPEAELQTKQQEPTDELKSDSDGKSEKAQPLDDESDNLEQQYTGETKPEAEMKGTELEVKENSAPVAEDVASSNNLAPLVSKNPEVVDDGDEQQKASQTNDAEPLQPSDNVEQHYIEETKPEAELQSKQQEPTDEQKSDSDGKNEKAQPLDDESDNVEQHYTEETKPKAELQTKQQEPTDELKSDSDGKNEKAQLLDDEPDANSALVGGAIEDRSYANDLQDENLGAQVEGDDEGLGIDEEGQLDYFGSGSSPNKIIEDLESRDRSEIDGQIVTDSEEEGESDEEGDGKELFDSAAFAALLKAATSAGSDPGTITITSQDGSRLFSVERPAGLGPSLRSVRPASGPRGSSFISPSGAAAPSEDDLSEEEKRKLQNLQQLKVKFLRLVQRAGFTAENSVAAQVLYKLSFFGGRPAFPAFSLDNAKQTAMQLEAEGKDDLDFSMTILVLGKTGVGKSAVINSIFLEDKVKINAFKPETTSVTEICGTVDGVKVKFIDVPGLKSSANEQSYNRKVLQSVKKVTKKSPVDVVLYVDRLDSQTRDLNDLLMLRTITASLGSSIWRNTIITLTHASSAPPDGPSGTPLSYEVFVAQRSHIVQQSIGQAVGDLRLMNLNMMSPVSLVENHPACRKNREGQKVLPNGQAWRPQLLVLCYSVKILSEASSISKPQEPFDSRKLFGFRARSPPLPYLLSSLLQPRAHPKLSADQGGDNVDSDIDLDDLSDSDQEEEVDEYDQLPPFKPLRKSQLAKLSGEQKKAYFEEYDYRVKLLQKKQWKEELKRMREMKKGKSRVGGYNEMPEGYDGEDGDGENGAPAAVPVPLPDMALPPSFDSDNPAYRYRFLEPTSQFLARPVLDTHGWDHDCGYDGVNIEQNLGIAGRIPAAVTAQVTKDKKDFNVHLDSAVAFKHGENGSSLVGFDVQSIGKQYAYIIKGESKFKNLKKNKTTAGASVTFLGENVASGIKVEDQITLGKRLVLVGSTGTVRSQKDAAYGANIEVRLRDADYPVGQEQSSFTLSLMKWRGDLAIGGNLQSQVSVGRNSKMALRVALNNKQSGQITVKTSSSDHVSIALAGLLPIVLSIYQKFKPGVSESYSIY